MRVLILPTKIKTFVSGKSLAMNNSFQMFCILIIFAALRRERNNCRICWSTTIAQGDFELSGATTEMGGDAVGTAQFGFGCCTYKSGFTGMTGYDCAKIPGASKATDSAELVNVVKGFCGGELGTAAAATIIAATVVATSCVTGRRVSFDEIAQF